MSPMDADCFSKEPGKKEDCKTCSVLGSCCREYNKYLKNNEKVWPGKLQDKWYKETRKKEFKRTPYSGWN